MIMQVFPSKPEGKVMAPASKSMAHRLLICAGMADGVSHIHGVQPSEDILATMDCLRALGISCDYDGDTVVVHGQNGPCMGTEHLFCRESGSTLRFMIPLCLLDNRDRVLHGSEKLLSRPLSVYSQICE